MAKEYVIGQKGHANGIVLNAVAVGTDEMDVTIRVKRPKNVGKSGGQPKGRGPYNPPERDEVEEKEDEQDEAEEEAADTSDAAPAVSVKEAEKR